MKNGSPVTISAPTRCCASSSKAASISLSVLAFRTISLHPTARAAACVSLVSGEERKAMSKFVRKLTIATTLVLIAGIAGSVFLFGLRASLRRVHDSQRFREALRIWTPVVQCRRVTPRAIKRFGNRLRYLAILQQHADLHETGFDKIRRRLKDLTW